MSAILSVAGLAFLAGVAMPIGAWLAKLERLQQYRFSAEVHHTVLAFGAGTLLSAVALVLVPQGIANIEPLPACGFFMLGGFIFMGLDILLDKWRTPASQLAAMLTDFVPESIALGATYVIHRESAILLALLIALQNMPEGFSAFRELRQAGRLSTHTLLVIFSVMALLGPIAAILGLVFLFDSPETVSTIMLLAAGAIFYSIFQDIAPKVVLEKHWLPPMGALLGFSLGLMGFMVIGADLGHL